MRTSPLSADVSVIIPQYGQVDLTRQLVAQIRKWEDHSVQIIVVDDGSPEFRWDLFAASHRVQLVSQSHQGVTSAWNFGAKLAGGSVLVFLNNDVSLKGTFLKRLILPLEDRRVSVTAPQFRTESSVPGDVLPSMSRRLPQGWCFAIQKSDYRLLSGFDEQFCMYFSDTDFLWRCEKEFPGKCFRQVDDLPIRHTAHQTTSHHPQRRRWHRDDRERFLRKWRAA